MAIVGKFLIAVGSLLLLHAGYYSVQYESYVKLAEVSDAQMPPFAAIVELALSFFISLVGVLLTAGEFLPIRSSESLYSRSLGSVVSSPEFHVFNHRGKALHSRIAS